MADTKWYKKLKKRNCELQREVYDLKQKLKSKENEYYAKLNIVVKECAILNDTKHRLEKENAELKEKYITQVANNLQLINGINNEH